MAVSLWDIQSLAFCCLGSKGVLDGICLQLPFPRWPHSCKDRAESTLAYPDHLSGWHGAILISREPSNHILSWDRQLWRVDLQTLTVRQGGNGPASCGRRCMRAQLAQSSENSSSLPQRTLLFTASSQAQVFRNLLLCTCWALSFHKQNMCVVLTV